MSDDFHTLPRSDGAALVIGRVILAWGSLDQLIETLLFEMWAIAERPGSRTSGVDPAPPQVNTAAGRWKELRRKTDQVVRSDKAAMAAFDRLCWRWKQLEPVRADLAHGTCLLSGDGHGVQVTSFRWEMVERGSARELVERTYTLHALNKTADAIRELQADLAQFIQNVRIPAIVEDQQRAAQPLPHPGMGGPLK